MRGPVGEGSGGRAAGVSDAPATAEADGAVLDALEALGAALAPGFAPVQAAMNVAIPPRAAPLRTVRRETGAVVGSLMCSSLVGRRRQRCACLDDERVLRDPGEMHLVAPVPQLVLRGALDVLLVHHHPRAPAGLDDVRGADPHVRGVGDDALEVVVACRRLFAVPAEADLL